ncbi:MAG: type II toxin-antitoxin system VapC family toxin [Dehalococcoidia bacterium]
MILADAAPVIASFNDEDPDHLRCAAVLLEPGQSFAIPSVVITEVVYFLARERKIAEEARFLRVLGNGSLPVLDPILADYLRAAALVEQYADFPLGTVDALIVAMAERLKVTTILTLDRRHFGAIRPLHCESFTLVP